MTTQNGRIGICALAGLVLLGPSVVLAGEGACLGRWQFEPVLAMPAISFVPPISS